MAFEYNKISIEQIYNFVCEIPGFSKKTNYEKIIIFFINIQEDFSDNINIDQEKTLINMNGKEILIDLFDAPKFINKFNFIDWIFNKIPQ